MGISLAVVTLWAEDVGAAVQFYTSVLGLAGSGGEPGGVAHLEVDGVYFTIMKGTPGKATNSIIPRFPVVAFSVDDLDRVVPALIAGGVELPWGVERSPAARWVMFHDPGGNLVEIVEFFPGSSEVKS